MLVISDHGYSTIQEVVDVEWYTRDAGFSDEEVLVAPNGGSALFYCQSESVTQRLAAWLMERPWCGALLALEAAGEIEGALPMSLRWRRGSESTGTCDVVRMGLPSERRWIQRLCLFNRRSTRAGPARLDEQA